MSTTGTAGATGPGRAGGGEARARVRVRAATGATVHAEDAAGGRWCFHAPGAAPLPGAVLDLVYTAHSATVASTGVTLVSARRLEPPP